jgi:8-oxo-dGTP pyrophosphatase MutT (NUDIX family)
MFIKIYCYNKPVYLCNEQNKDIKNLLLQKNVVYSNTIDNKSMQVFLQQIESETNCAGVIEYTNFIALKQAFFASFTAIEAAGGIVENSANEILFIYRLNKWDLPKGKVEIGENIQAAAIREIEEETGATNLTLQHKIGETYHTYKAFGKHFLKTTHWYYVTCIGSQQLVPQTTEDITALQWIPKQQVHEPLANTYQNIIDIIFLFTQKKIS